MGETLGNAQDASLGETFGNGIFSGQVLLVYICIVYRGLLEVPSKSIDRGQRGLIALDARLPDWAWMPHWPWMSDCPIAPALTVVR